MAHWRAWDSQGRGGTVSHLVGDATALARGIARIAREGFGLLVSEISRLPRGSLITIRQRMKAAGIGSWHSCGKPKRWCATHRVRDRCWVIQQEKPVDHQLKR